MFTLIACFFYEAILLWSFRHRNFNQKFICFILLCCFFSWHFQHQMFQKRATWIKALQIHKIKWTQVAPRTMNLICSFISYVFVCCSWQEHWLKLCLWKIKVLHSHHPRSLALTVFESRYSFFPTAEPLKDTSTIVILDACKTLGTGYIWEPFPLKWAEVGEEGRVHTLP